MARGEPQALYVALVCLTRVQFESPLDSLKLYHGTFAWAIGSAGALLKLTPDTVFPQSYPRSTSYTPIRTQQLTYIWYKNTYEDRPLVLRRQAGET